MATAKKDTTPRTVAKVEAGENKKKMVVMRKEGTTLWCIGFENGGEVPQKLSGLYTSIPVAEIAIENYLANRK